MIDPLTTDYPSPRRVLRDIANARFLLCLLQQEITRQWNLKLRCKNPIEQKHLAHPADADIAHLSADIGKIADHLVALRKELKEIAPRTWRIHTLGLALVLEEENMAEQNMAEQNMAEQNMAEQNMADLGGARGGYVK